MRQFLVGARKNIYIQHRKDGCKPNLKASGGRFDYHRLQSCLKLLSEFHGGLWHVRDRYSEYLEKVIGGGQFLNLTRF